MLRYVAVVLSLLGGLVAQDPARALTDDQREVFALLDEFDSLDTSKLPFVAVVLTLEGQRWERFGFLESSDARQFRVRYVDLGRATLEVRKETVGRAGASFEPSDLRIAVAKAVERAKQRDENRHGLDYYMTPSQPMPPVVWMLFLARACARANRVAEVNELWEALPDDYRSREKLTGRYGAHELGSALDHRLALDFTDPRLSWSDLLARHEKWLELFDKHFFKDHVLARRDSIVSYLQERRGRDELPRTGKPSAADLVFDLHDEFHAGLGNLYFDASEVGCPEPRPPHGMRPTDRLVDLELAAVPALIEAMSDKGPTRSVLYSSRFGGGFRVETMSALAECALVEISGWRAGRGAAGPWREWYARAQKEGLRKLAEAGVASLAPEAVAMFLRRWPKDFDTVLDALRKAEPAQLHAGLFHQLMTSSNGAPDERVLAIFADAVRRIEDSYQQMSLAKLLLDHGDTGGVGSVLAHWQAGVRQERKPMPDLQRDPRAFSEWQRESWEHDQMLEFLVGTGDLAVWRAIGDACARPDVRRSLGVQLLKVRWTDARRRAKENEAADVETAFRKCLMQLLADDELVASGVAFRQEGRAVALHEASCADVAACVLAATWPKEFPFDPARTATVRHRQILALRGTPSAKPPVAAPGGSAADALVRANRVERVVIHESAAALDATAQEGIRAMKGKPLTAEGLLELVINTARVAKGLGVVCACERSGEGDGTSLTISCRPVFEGGAQTVSTGTGSGGRWDVRLLVTAGGAELGSEGLAAGGKLAIEQLEEHGNYLGAIRKALDSRADAGVEITFAVQTK